MIQEKIRIVREAFNRVHLPSQRGFPAGIQPELTAPMGVVQVHHMDKDTVTLSATVYSPTELGASVCEDAAVGICQNLEENDATIEQESCRYDSTAGLLSLRILATWQFIAQEPTDIPCTVLVEEEPLPYLTGVFARQTVEYSPVEAIGEGTYSLRREKMAWEVTVEELLPRGCTPPEAELTAFALDIRREDGRERYPQCHWVSVQRQDTPQGVRQVRIAHTEAQREVVYA